MYHISSDKRSVQSAELIYLGLLDCLKRKPFERISISDIQKASTVARTTFYRSFDTIYDVLYWKCDACFYEVLSSYRPEQFLNELELVFHYFQYWMSHSDILELLIRINRHDIIYACHIKNAESLRNRISPVPGLSIPHSNYFISIRTGFTISILTTWLKGGRKESPEEIVEILREQLAALAKSSI